MDNKFWRNSKEEKHMHQKSHMSKRKRANSNYSIKSDEWFNIKVRPSTPNQVKPVETSNKRGSKWYDSVNCACIVGEDWELF